MSDLISLGISTTIMGMGIVFSVLAVLAFVIFLLVKIVDGNSTPANGNGNGRSNGNANPKATDNNTALAAAVKTPVPEQTVNKINAQTIAAIMAAVSAASGRPVADLKFTAIRRKTSVSFKWAEASKTEIINNAKNF